MKTEQHRREEMFEKIINFIDNERFSGQPPLPDEWKYYNAAIDDCLKMLRRDKEEIL